MASSRRTHDVRRSEAAESRYAVKRYPTPGSVWMNRAPILRRRFAMCTRRTWTSSAYSGPQTSTSSVPVGHQPPAVRRQDAQQVELDRGQVHRLAVHLDRVSGQIELEPVGADHRLGHAGVGAAQRRLQPRDELARPERLGHVVVGAGRQRAHLLVLLADRREHEDRHPRPLAQALGHLDAVAVGQHEVDDRRRRRAQRRLIERLLGRRGLQHLEARVAQDDPQRAQDLRLVVDDEYAGTVVHGRLSVRCPVTTRSSWAWPRASARRTGCSRRRRRRPRRAATS